MIRTTSLSSTRHGLTIDPNNQKVTKNPWQQYTFCIACAYCAKVFGEKFVKRQRTGNRMTSQIVEFQKVCLWNSDNISFSLSISFGVKNTTGPKKSFEQFERSEIGCPSEPAFYFDGKSITEVNTCSIWQCPCPDLGYYHPCHTPSFWRKKA